ncbi:PD-(D/E)XK nuclease family protein, partial [Eubacterium sp.]
RMRQAQSRGELFREQKFLLGKKACEVNPNTDSEELVVIQGIIDVCFIENGRYYVVDYKTDKVRKMEQLYDKYSVQLDYYKEAIEQITGKKVEDEIIYSVTLGDEISFTEHRQRRQ